MVGVTENVGVRSVVVPVARTVKKSVPRDGNGIKFVTCAKGTFVKTFTPLVIENKSTFGKAVLEKIRFANLSLAVVSVGLSI